MDSLTRGQEIVTALEGVGVRATTDPAALAPPCVLVPPPDHTFDLACGSSLLWRLVALGTTTTSADRESWSQLDQLVTGALSVLDVESAALVAYSVNGKPYPAYLLTIREAL